MTTTSTVKPVSLRGYAMHRGCTHEAVRKAISQGRLKNSIVTVNGKPKITDVGAADAEWSATTRPSAADDPSWPEAMADKALPVRTIEPTTARPAPPPRAESLARLEAAKAELAEIELKVKRGEYAPTAELRDEICRLAHETKTKLLAVPSKLKQRRPEVSRDAIREVDDLIREALTSIADAGAAAGARTQHGDDSDEYDAA